MKGTGTTLQAPGRIAEYDILRVRAILLVVLGHVQNRGLDMGSEYASYVGHIHRNLVALIYSFHMPLFFLLSGACAGVASLSITGKMVRKRSLRLLLPYFVFGTLFVPVWTMCLEGLPQPYGMWELFLRHLTFNYGHGGSLHVWFLPALFTVSMATAAVHRMCAGRLAAPLVLFTLSASFLLAGYFLIGGSTFIPQVALWKDWFWYVLGAYGLPVIVRWRAGSRWALAAACAASFILLVAVFFLQSDYPALSSRACMRFAFGCGLILLGSLSFTLLAKCLCLLRVHECRWFRPLVAATMSIFLYHLFFQFLFCTLVRRMGWEAGFGYYALETLGATLLSVLAWYLLGLVKRPWREALGG